MKTFVLTAAVLLCLPACTSTTTIGGDASADPRPDTSADSGTDSAPDARPDTPPDLPPDGTETCLPSEGVIVDWSIAGDVGEESHVVDMPCVVNLVEEEAYRSTVQFVCGGGIVSFYEIDIFADPHIWPGLIEGDNVQLSFITIMRWIEKHWFVVRDTWGGIRMAGVYADTLAPYGFTTDEWYDPIDVRALGGLCEPVEEPWGCGVRERQALDVGFWDARAVVFDGTYTYAGFMDLVLLQVGQAWRYTEVYCEDVPEAWYSAIFVFQMEG
jgi:hypothetical protein